VHPKRLAKLDPELMAWINHELYCFSDRASLRRFQHDPLKYCGLVTDPVSRARFHPSPRSPRLEYRQRPYYFMAESTLTTFKAMPDSFALRRGM
jgi:YHS domain-containing protein